VTQLFIGWNSDRLRERRFHTLVPLTLAALALGLAPQTAGNLTLTISASWCVRRLKAYLPAFWSCKPVPTDVAAAGTIGLINSVGNLGGFSAPPCWARWKRSRFIRRRNLLPQRFRGMFGDHHLPARPRPPEARPAPRAIAA